MSTARSAPKGASKAANSVTPTPANAPTDAVQAPAANIHRPYIVFIGTLRAINQLETVINKHSAVLHKTTIADRGTDQHTITIRQHGSKQMAAILQAYHDAKTGRTPLNSQLISHCISFLQYEAEAMVEAHNNSPPTVHLTVKHNPTIHSHQ